MLAVCLYYLDIASDTGLSSLGSGKMASRALPCSATNTLAWGFYLGKPNTSAEHGVLGSSQPAPPVLLFNLGSLAIPREGEVRPRRSSLVPLFVHKLLKHSFK